ncbi:WecB/TagA/CpsF family glycosyltransferase [Microbacterium sp.]|uniref:WecB/TagA/CpsF family glycosyltransferase n=1 Tax=Microbacterium sp. TaxID=51671 RepID=UPI0025FA9CF5|nr:WecB/TagA/CpsF family glycosyltransferase [Microbacterium sp.]MBT9606343.1 WecB/TagA/CpsF family glycosyltransferase [Microbacterium sp.]
MMRDVLVRPVAVRLTPMSADEVAGLLVDKPVDQTTLVLNHNLHSLYLFHSLGWFRDFYSRAGIILVDGWPVLRLLRLSGHGRFDHTHRIGSTDWLETLIRTPKREDFRVFVLGGTDETVQRACATLQSGPAGMVAAGRSGYFDPLTESGSVLDDIRKFRPHLLLVGMGMPRQERFIQDHFDALPACYVATVGGAIDYLAGTQRLAPRWFGRFGVEWLWRLGNDPRRLWHRYLVEPIKLAAIVIANRSLKRGAWGEVGSDGDR